MNRFLIMIMLLPRNGHKSPVPHSTLVPSRLALRYPCRYTFWNTKLLLSEAVQTPV
jgi:hypothetical protein